MRVKRSKPENDSSRINDDDDDDDRKGALIRDVM